MATHMERYEAMKAVNDAEHAEFTSRTKQPDFGTDADLALLAKINREYAVLRKFEKNNGIYRFPAIVVGNTTYQAL